MGVMELMEFLDSEFSVTPADDEITEANLGTLASIARFVAAKKNG
jgi:acyl carrier protein